MLFKVLLVDDEPMIREGLKTLIPWSRHGYQIVGEAVHGRDGLEKYHKLRPDLILVDLKMPGMNGLQMVEEIRKLDVCFHFIVLTGYSEFHYAQKAIDLGVDGYLLKPIDPDALREKVDRIYMSLSKALSDKDHVAAQLNRSKPDDFLHKMLAYIHSNYAEDLKLETLAEVFHYNSGYLGKLFKRSTGDSFHTHLDKVRIEKAKELLSLGCKVYETASKTGYANADYFHVKFKKYVGLSPSHFRKRFMSGTEQRSEGYDKNSG